jgi:hypothetical protein
MKRYFLECCPKGRNCIILFLLRVQTKTLIINNSDYQRFLFYVFVRKYLISYCGFHE